MSGSCHFRTESKKPIINSLIRKRIVPDSMITYTHLDTPFGRFLATAENDCLTGLYFTDQRGVGQPQAGWLRDEEAVLFQHTARQLQEYCDGHRKIFDLPVQLAGTPFQRRVWDAIAAIPFGETVSYSEIAHRIGSPASVRAVGTAAGRNPVCWIVPCHRVIGKKGALTGYAGGLPRKRAFLAFEAAFRSASLDLPIAA